MGLKLRLVAEILGLFLLHGLLFCAACKTRHYVFNVESVPYTRLCSTKNIMTINGQFPGPTLYARRGDIVIVKVYNHATENITIHWHGVLQPRNPWSDGPEYITQCPLKPGTNFTYKIILSSEEGTLWWHAHNDFIRATVHGAIVVYPKPRTPYPFRRPSEELVILLGEWWKADVYEVLEEAKESGGNFNVSDAFTINGQPGDLYPCSKEGTSRMLVEHGKTYLLRLVNVALSDGLFFSIAGHNLTVVGSDGSYLKPLTTEYLLIYPGETMDVLLEANQPPTKLYYMAARALSYIDGEDNTTTTAILEYASDEPLQSTIPVLPPLPYYNDTAAAVSFSSKLRSPEPVQVPVSTDHRMLIAVAVNELPCNQSSCDGPNGTRLAASLNNISYVDTTIDILGAYYQGIRGVYGEDFPDLPPEFYNFTADDQPASALTPEKATEVKVVEWGETIEVVFQGTSLVAAEGHPMHLHGFGFYVVGQGFGNFNAERDVPGFNLVDPPLKNTFAFPIDGWSAIRFTADNPGVWFLHCHFDRHLIWGMETAFIVKNGPNASTSLLPPPRYRPPC